MHWVLNSNPNYPPPVLLIINIFIEEINLEISTMSWRIGDPRTLTSGWRPFELCLWFWAELNESKFSDVNKRERRMEVKLKCELEKTEEGADMRWFLAHVPTKPPTPRSPLLGAFPLIWPCIYGIRTHNLTHSKAHSRHWSPESGDWRVHESKRHPTNLLLY